MQTLEARFAHLYGVPGAVATGFGRGAIYLALQAIQVRGAPVLLPQVICRQVVDAVLRAGGLPVYYPVSLDLAIRPAEFRAAIPAEARAAILVHYFGVAQPEIAALAGICRERGLVPVEDCALALLTPAMGGRCGGFADYATFSLTKNDWCYGGGMAIAREPSALERMQQVVDTQFVDDDVFCERYGALSHIDFDANCPLLAESLAREGQRLQQEYAAADERFCAANFFDAPGTNMRMGAQAAHRAMQVLAEEPSNRVRRQAAQRTLCAAVEARRTAGGAIQVVGQGSSFMVLQFGPGSGGGMAQRIEQAARHGITLRRMWSAYQAQVPQTAHAEHVAVLELHPSLTNREIQIMQEWISCLA